MTTFPFWASLDGMPRMRTQIATFLFFKRQDEIFAEIFIWPIGKKIAYNFILIESIQFIFIETYHFGYGISLMAGMVVRDVDFSSGGTKLKRNFY